MRRPSSHRRVEAFKTSGPRILLVRLRLIGDVVFTTPVIAALRRRYPDAHITYLVEAHAAAVVRGNPHIDDLIVIDKSSGWRRVRDDLSLARQLRARRFDMAIDLHGGPRAAWFTRASGAPIRIGYAIAGRRWMYTRTVPRAADLTPRHSVQNQWDLLSALDLGPPDPARNPVEMPDDAGAVARVEQALREAGVPRDHTVAVIHVSAGNPFRRWPEQHFVELAVRLVRDAPTHHVVFFSGPSDAGAGARITAQARQQAGARAHAIHDIGGSFDIAEIRALASLAAVYIGGDSGPMHVAATTAVPIVAMLGPTLAERSRPWRDDRIASVMIDGGPLPCRPCHQRVCVPGDFRCLTRITPGQVQDAVEHVGLGPRRGPGEPHEDA
jgi:lipopolysaccharide heptosyltransferase II